MIVELLLAAALAASGGERAPVGVQAQPVIEIPVEKPATPGKKEEVPAAPVVTRHSVSAGGKKIDYTATAGMLPVTDDAGDVQAEIFFTAYTVEARKGEARPLLFAFNGGPGSSSVWLHLGALGPRRVDISLEKGIPGPPYRMEDNGESWLEFADLVFVDPVGTGYSRAEKKEMIGKFTSLSGDVESLGRFIRLYISRYARWNSPLFLVGESYGSMRAAGLADYLLARGISLNGIVLISCILNMQTVSYETGNDLPYHLILPSYAATAWYHGKLAAELQGDLAATLKEAEEFAARDFLLALEKGDRLPEQELKGAAEKLARLTGLPREMLERMRLRVDLMTFARQLLQSGNSVTGILDTRLTASFPPEDYRPILDPTLSQTKPLFTMTFNGYAAGELGFRTDREYYILGEGVGSWDWGAKNSYADTSANLADSLRKNPAMKVFVASGIFDIATPYFATAYTLSHLGLNTEALRGIEVHRYPSGHMIYLDRENLARLKRDVDHFVRRSAAAAPPSARVP